MSNTNIKSFLETLKDYGYVIAHYDEDSWEYLPVGESVIDKVVEQSLRKAVKVN